MCEKLKALYIESYYNYQKASAKEVGIMYGIFLGVRKCCNILYSQKLLQIFKFWQTNLLTKGCDEMDYNAVAQIVSTLGFPIVMCGVLVWLNVKQMNAHAESEENFTNALADNTKAYIELKDAISILKVKGEQ